MKNKRLNSACIECLVKKHIAAYPGDAKEEDKGLEFTPYMLIPAIAVVCVVAFGIVCLISKKTGKEDKVNVQE